MLFNKAVLAALAAGTVSAVPLFDKRQFTYGSTPVRGVNIGGWLVLEPWITPSIFDNAGGAAVDEYTLCQNTPDAASVLQSHWASWATQGDFQRIAGSGFNLVRIPVGYWAFEKYEQDPYVQGAADYLDQAIGWARGAGLKVWIDLHGAPLSQNGFDNSGQRTDSPQWTAGDSVSFTTGVIDKIAQKYGSGYDDVVVGIELLNEPLMGSIPGGRGATAGYYQNGFDTVRNYGDVGVVIHDGFDTPSSWNGFLTGQGAAGALVDHHEYQVFSQSDVAMSYEDHASQVSARASGWAGGVDKYLICGEWTGAMTDCAKYLNGYGVGARYDGSYNKNGEGSSYVGSCDGKSDISSWDQAMRDGTTNYIKAQISTFESQMQGWIFWNFKTEGSGEWDLFKLQDAGIWPGF